MQHPTEDDLALLALGESAPPVDAHVRGCPACAHEVGALTAAVRTARDSDLDSLQAPPSSVWDRVREELGLAEPAHVPVRRRAAFVGAGAVLAAAAAAAVVLTTQGAPARPEPVQGPSVSLVALGPVQASGQVALAASPDRRALRVQTSGLPRPDGLYEVWLLDLEQDRLVALGALDDSGSGWLTVPSGIDLGDYPVVDISLEPHDGDPSHSGDSVLRGELPA